MCVLGRAASRLTAASGSARWDGRVRLLVAVSSSPVGFRARCRARGPVCRALRGALGRPAGPGRCPHLSACSPEWRAVLRGDSVNRVLLEGWTGRVVNFSRTLRRKNTTPSYSYAVGHTQNAQDESRSPQWTPALIRGTARNFVTRQPTHSVTVLSRSRPSNDEWSGF